MTTTKFFTDYGSALDAISKNVLKINDYSICSNGVRASVTTDKYDSLEKFADNNGVFYFENLADICEALPRDMAMDEFELVIDVSFADDNGVYAKGTISYKNCFRVVNCNSRMRTFGEDEYVDDGFVIFNEVKVGEMVKVEKKEVEKRNDDNKTFSFSDAFQVLADMARAFSEAKADKDGKLSKSFSFNIDGSGKCHFEKVVNGEKVVYDGNVSEVE